MHLLRLWRKVGGNSSLSDGRVAGLSLLNYVLRTIGGDRSARPTEKQTGPGPAPSAAGAAAAADAADAHSPAFFGS